MIILLRVCVKNVFQQVRGAVSVGIVMFAGIKTTQVNFAHPLAVGCFLSVAHDAEAIVRARHITGIPVGTTRIRSLSDSLVKIERVAVLSQYRGLGIGRQLMDVAIAHIRHQGIFEIKINAQTHARKFYDKLGFEQQGDEFDEAGIPHIEMRLRL